MNETFTYIEIGLVLIVILLQTNAGISAYSKINEFKRLIASSDYFKLVKAFIPYNLLQQKSPKFILSEVKNFLNLEESLSRQTWTSEVSLINPIDSHNTFTDEILKTINFYLIKNKGATTNFALVKDIVERNVELKEDEIRQSITTPLYLGLMGTILGIVFGLANLYFVTSEGKEFNVEHFLLGVAIAMIASLYGLGWTTFNSSRNFKNARYQLDVNKNNFYSFVQTELLPELNQTVSNSIADLHKNLINFNTDFGKNVNNLSGILNKNYEAVIAQDNLLASLENIDIVSFSKANVNILRQLTKGMKDLEGFVNQITLLRSFADSSSDLSTSFRQILTKTNNFEELAIKLEQRVDESNKLALFLSKHVDILEKRKNDSDVMIKEMEDVLIKSLDELKTHTLKQIDSIKDITLKEEDLLASAFAENRSQLSKLSELTEVKNNLNDVNKNLNRLIHVFEEGNTESNLLLADISSKGLAERNHNSVWINLKNIFKSKHNG